MPGGGARAVVLRPRGRPTEGAGGAQEHQFWSNSREESWWDTDWRASPDSGGRGEAVGQPEIWRNPLGGAQQRRVELRAEGRRAEAAERSGGYGNASQSRSPSSSSGASGFGRGSEEAKLHDRDEQDRRWRGGEGAPRPPGGWRPRVVLRPSGGPRCAAGRRSPAARVPPPAEPPLPPPPREWRGARGPSPSAEGPASGSGSPAPDASLERAESPESVGSSVVMAAAAAPPAGPRRAGADFWAAAAAWGEPAAEASGSSSPSAQPPPPPAGAASRARLARGRPHAAPRAEPQASAPAPARAVVSDASPPAGVVATRRKRCRTHGAAGPALPPPAAPEAPPAAPAAAPPAPAALKRPCAAKSAPPAPGARKSRRVAAHHAASPASDAALTTAPADAHAEGMTEEEQNELANTVLARLRRSCSATEEQQLEELAGFVVTMVEHGQPPHEMAEELGSLLGDEVGPFLGWLDMEKARLVGRASSQGPPRLRAKLTTNDVTASLDRTNAATAGTDMNGASAAHEPDDPQSLVVVTQRLVLQPNAGQVGSSEEAAQARRDPKDLARTARAARRVELLAEMTRKLQDILRRLSGKGLSDKDRERYQAMAQSIQEGMRQIGEAC